MPLMPLLMTIHPNYDKLRKLREYVSIRTQHNHFRWRSPYRLVIIIIILIHYHKGLSAVGLDLPTGSLGLRFPAHHPRAVSYLGVYQLCKAIEKNIQLGTEERGVEREGKM